MRYRRLNLFLVLVTGLCAIAKLPAEDDIKELKLRDWEPKSMLVTKTTIVEKPRFPVTDIHNHLGGGKKYLTPERVQKYLTEMDEAGVRTVVNLDGGWGERLQETLAALDQAHPGRFATFALVNFEGIDDEGWTAREVQRLEEGFKLGARGLKIPKTLGLGYKYKDGKIMPVDDPKLDAIWETCGKHQKPVVIHVSDPAAFFTPLDRYNERWHELNANPHWLFYGPQYPQRQEILDQLHRAIAKHPQTKFVNTHFGNNAEDLKAVGEQLDKYPNMYVDFDARISELGRQPYSARRFFIKYQDRILFGTDTTPRRDAFRIYYRFLETDDEYFDCRDSHHLQGFWRIYGIFLPDDVLEKIYYQNAEKVLGSTKPPEAGKQALKLNPSPQTLQIKSTADFDITGDGKNEAWSRTEWKSLYRRNGAGLPLLVEPANKTQMKMLYSDTGLYVLFEGADAKVTATIDRDFANLWEEDCFELFLWPDDKQPSYFEYEISPLNHELPLLISAQDGKRRRWQPWYFDQDGGETTRKVRRATSVIGGDKTSGATISSWTAELFIPYGMLQPLANVPPKPGTTWRANFYRVDHDDKKSTGWSWVPVRGSFHDLEKFGTLAFE